MDTIIVGTRYVVRISPECLTHYEAYGDQIDLVQDRLVEVVPSDYLSPSQPADPAHTVPVLWATRPIPALPWAGGWFAECELNPMEEPG